jgi:ADP-ribose pyrophosphatase YjhB (NUDIX family)
MGELRPTCPSCGWVHYEDPKVAAGVVVIKDDAILLVRRVTEPYARQWTIPAGFVNAYEDPAEAAIRECREETGLLVELDGLHEMLTGREHPRGSDIFLIYQARVIGGNLRAADDADEAAWFPLDDLPDLAFNSTKKVVAALRAN